MSTLTTPTRELTRNELIEQNLPLVGYCVSHALVGKPAHVSRDDLTSVGHVALVKAADSFNPDLGVPFTRYANLRIRGAILDELRSMDWLSRGNRTRVKAMNATVDTLSATLGHTPTDAEIAAAMGITLADVTELRATSDTMILSMDFGDNDAFSESVASPWMNPEDEVLHCERVMHLRAAMAELPERMAEIIDMVFYQGLSVSEIGEAMGVSQSRISQIKAEALALIGQAMHRTLDPDLADELEGKGAAARRRNDYYTRVATRSAAAAASAQYTLAAMHVANEAPWREPLTA